MRYREQRPDGDAVDDGGERSVQAVEGELPDVVVPDTQRALVRSGLVLGGCAQLRSRPG